MTPLANESFVQPLAKRWKEVHPCAKLTHKIAAAAAAKISARRRHGKKNQDFYENLENEKIAKNIEKIDENR